MLRRFTLGLFLLGFLSLTGVAFAGDDSFESGTIGVARVVDHYTVQDSYGRKIVVIVTPQEDYDRLKDGATFSGAEPFLIDIVGMDLHVAVRGACAADWLSGRETRSHQRVYIVPAERADDWE